MKTATKLKVPSDFFDPRATLECGQVFRYAINPDGSFVVHSLDKRCTLRECGEYIELETAHPDYFYNYFDLTTDYGKITKTLAAHSELTAAVEYGKGIRILRQDLFETVVSFIISANNNIARIKSIIERVCDRYGEDRGEYRAFPTCESLSRSTPDELKALGLGYRAAYLPEAVSAYERVESVLKATTNAQKAHEILLTLKGVGDKVADCIVLFGLHLTRSYPVDTWIFKANSTAELNTPKKVREHFLDRYGEYAGFAQQYIFHYARKGGGLSV